MSNATGKVEGGQQAQVFNADWTMKFFFVEVSVKCVCLVCNEIVAVLKE